MDQASAQIRTASSDLDPLPRLTGVSKVGGRETVSFEIPAVRLEVDAEVLARAVYVLGSGKLAVDWLRHKWPALDYRTPVEVAQTASGREDVMTLLGQIEYGVYV